MADEGTCVGVRCYFSELFIIVYCSPTCFKAGHFGTIAGAPFADAHVLCGFTCRDGKLYYERYFTELPDNVAKADEVDIPGWVTALINLILLPYKTAFSVFMPKSCDSSCCCS